MTSKKKHLINFMLLCMVLIGIFLIPQTANADDSDFVIEDGVLTKYTGSEGDVVIPDGVTEIGASAFKDCSSLTSITIPNSVTEIGSSAFSGCSNLIDVSIPESVTVIGGSAFSSCENLTNITLPNSITEIGICSFFGCGLTNISLPDSVFKIGVNAFSSCSNLENIIIPDSVTEIGAFAFINTPWLDKKKNEHEDHFVIVNNILIDGRTATGSVSIPSGITKIGDSAFDSCQLTSISIPEGVTKIGERAFYSCPNLKDVKFPNSLSEISANAFCYCTKLSNIEIPNGVVKIGRGAFKTCVQLKNIVFPRSIESIGYYAIDNCTSLECVTIFNEETSLQQEVINGEFTCIFGSNFISAFHNPVIVKGYNGSTAEEMVTQIKQYVQSPEKENIIFEALDGTGNTGSATSTPTPTAVTNLDNTVKPSETDTPSPTSSTGTKPDNTIAPSVTPTPNVSSTENASEDMPVSLLKKITITKTMTIKKGKSKTIKVTLPNSLKKVSKFTGKTGQVKIKYTSANKRVAAVNQKSKVTAKKKGNTKITVTISLQDGTNRKCTVKVTVK